MPNLSPSTLTRSEQEVMLHATACHPRDHVVYSLALGTSLRLAEIVGLNVGCDCDLETSASSQRGSNREKEFSLAAARAAR